MEAEPEADADDLVRRTVNESFPLGMRTRLEQTERTVHVPVTPPPARPAATVAKLIKERLPPDIKLSADAPPIVQSCLRGACARMRMIGPGANHNHNHNPRPTRLISCRAA